MGARPEDLVLKQDHVISLRIIDAYNVTHMPRGATLRAYVSDWHGVVR